MSQDKKPKLRRVKYGPEGWHFDQANAFNAALGEAFSAWQNVETAAFVLFHCLSETDFETSSIIYFHITSFENKKSLISKLILNNIGQTIYAGPWKELTKRLDINIEVRNAMAHFKLVGGNLSEIGSFTQLPYLMTPDYLNHYASRSGREKALTYETLLAKPTQFTRLADDLIGFSHRHVPSWEKQRVLLPQDLAQVLARAPGIDGNSTRSGTPKP